MCTLTVDSKASFLGFGTTYGMCTRDFVYLDPRTQSNRVGFFVNTDAFGFGKSQSHAWCIISAD